MDLDVAQKIAETLNVSLSDVLGIGGAHAAAQGFHEDVQDYVSGSGYSFAGSLGPNESLMTVDTDLCENAGVKRGYVVTVNDSAAAVAAIAPLDIVIAIYHHPETPEKATKLLRQFVPPSLLITNSGSSNARSINIAKEDAQIISIVTGINWRRHNGQN